MATTDVAPAAPGVHEHVATPAVSVFAPQPVIVVPPAVNATVPPDGAGETVAVSVTADPLVGDAELVSAVVVAMYGATAVDDADGVSFVMLVRSVMTRK